MRASTSASATTVVSGTRLEASKVGWLNCPARFLILIDNKHDIKMPPPSPLNIKLSVTLRLVKEEASYHKEWEESKQRLEKMIKEDADEYEIRQQVRRTC